MYSKGQIKSRADWRAIDSPKKRPNKFVLFDFLLLWAKRINCSFIFGGNLQCPNLLMVQSFDSRKSYLGNSFWRSIFLIQDLYSFLHLCLSQKFPTAFWNFVSFSEYLNFHEIHPHFLNIFVFFIFCNLG